MLHGWKQATSISACCSCVSLRASGAHSKGSTACGLQGLGFGAYISVCQATEFGFPGKTKPWAGAVVSSGCSVSSGVSVAHVSVVSVRRGLMH